jgi:hypothetical protein
VLEHIRNLPAALANVHSYLRPGGQFVAMLSGKFAVQAVLSRLLAAPSAAHLMRHLLGRDPASVFPAYCDHCYHRALIRLLEPWAGAEVTPFFQGGAYFNFSPLARRAYFIYEDWAARGARVDLATHYLIVARR